MLFDRIEESSGYCGKCLAQVPVRKPTVRHWPHIILTLLTGGVWAIGWVMDVRRARTYSWRCLKCGCDVHKIMAALKY